MTAVTLRRAGAPVVGASKAVEPVPSGLLSTTDRDPSGLQPTQQVGSSHSRHSAARTAAVAAPSKTAELELLHAAMSRVPQAFCAGVSRRGENAERCSQLEARRVPPALSVRQSGHASQHGKECTSFEPWPTGVTGPWRIPYSVQRVPAGWKDSTSDGWRRRRWRPAARDRQHATRTHARGSTDVWVARPSHACTGSAPRKKGRPMWKGRQERWTAGVGARTDQLRMLCSRLAWYTTRPRTLAKGRVQ